MNRNRKSLLAVVLVAILFPGTQSICEGWERAHYQEEEIIVSFLLPPGWDRVEFRKPKVHFDAKWGLLDDSDQAFVMLSLEKMEPGQYDEAGLDEKGDATEVFAQLRREEAADTGMNALVERVGNKWFMITDEALPALGKTAYLQYAMTVQSRVVLLFLITEYTDSNQRISRISHRVLDSVELSKVVSPNP